MIAAFICLVAMGTNDAPVAFVNGHELGLSQLEVELTALTHNEKRYRKEMNHDSRRVFLDLVRRIALRDAVETWSKGVGFVDAKRAFNMRMAGRTWFLEFCRQRDYGTQIDLDADERRRIAALKPKAWPDRVRVSHIFLAAADGDARQAAKSELQVFLSKKPDLNGFRSWAKSHSDGQTAWKGGRLGYIKRGMILPSIEDVLFRTPAETTTEPLVTPEGVHAFFVESREMERQQDLNALRRRETAKVLAQKRTALQEDLVETSRRAFPAVHLADGRVRIGEIECDPAFLSEPQTIDSWIRDEQLSRLLKTFDWNGFPVDRVWRACALDTLVIDAVVEKAHEIVVFPNATQIRARYDSEPGLSQSPALFQYRVIQCEIPMDSDPYDFYDRFRLATTSLDDRDDQWSEVASRYSGSFRKTPWLSRSELFKQLPVPVVEVLRQRGRQGLERPVQDGRVLWMVSLSGRRDAGRQSFAEASSKIERVMRREAQLKAESFAVEMFLESADFCVNWENYDEAMVERALRLD